MYTKQEAFDKAWHGVIGQGGPSLNLAGCCVYVGPNGRRCAVGCLLDEDQTRNIKEGMGIGCFPFADSLVDGGRLFLEELQEAHDNAARNERESFINGFKRRMTGIATMYGLNIPDGVGEGTGRSWFDALRAGCR